MGRSKKQEARSWKLERGGGIFAESFCESDFFERVAMSQYRSNARMEKMDQHYQATSAAICGDVTIGEDCSFWFGVTVRGDVAPIVIGKRVNVQENAVLHCDSGKPLEVGDDVTIGHGAIVHNAKIGRGALIGMAATLLGDCVVGEDAMVAAGAVLSPGTVVPDRMVAMGVPAKVVRPIREAELEWNRKNCAHYVELAREHVAEGGKFSGGST